MLIRVFTNFYYLCSYYLNTATNQQPYWGAQCLYWGDGTLCSTRLRPWSVKYFQMVLARDVRQALLPPANSTADRDKSCSHAEPVPVPTAAPAPTPAVGAIPSAPEPQAPECDQAEAGGASWCVCCGVCVFAPFGGARCEVCEDGAMGASNSGTGLATAADMAG